MPDAHVKYFPAKHTICPVRLTKLHHGWHYDLLMLHWDSSGDPELEAPQ